MDFNNLLINVHSRLEDLGEARFEKSKRNQFGETAIKADIEAENVITEALKFDITPAKVISEEHGTFDILDNPKLLVIIDGLDGSKRYAQTKGKSRVSTMLAVLNGINPLYGDYIYCGMVEHNTGRLLYASKGSGCKLLNLKSTKIKQVTCAQTTTLDDDTKMYIDSPYPGTDALFARVLGQFKPMLADSSAAAYIDVAIGTADLNLESTRKGNLEAAVSFGIINESGGVMVDKKGESLGTKKYFEFGQKDQQAIVTASTFELAKEVVSYIQ